MGMFDDPQPFTEKYEEGAVFTLQDAKIGNVLMTKHGNAAPVLLKIEGAWYSIFGEGITNQVGRMDPGDLPARVKIERVDTKGGNSVKLLVPEGSETPRGVED